MKWGGGSRAERTSETANTDARLTGYRGCPVRCAAGRLAGNGGDTMPTRRITQRDIRAIVKRCELRIIGLQNDRDKLLTKRGYIEAAEHNARIAERCAMIAELRGLCAGGQENREYR